MEIFSVRVLISVLLLSGESSGLQPNRTFFTTSNRMPDSLLYEVTYDSVFTQGISPTTGWVIIIGLTINWLVGMIGRCAVFQVCASTWHFRRPINLLILVDQVVNTVSVTCRLWMTVLTIGLNQNLSTYLGHSFCTGLFQILTFGIMYAVFGSFSINLFRLFYVNANVEGRNAGSRWLPLAVKILTVTVGVTGILTFTYTR